MMSTKPVAPDPVRFPADMISMSCADEGMRDSDGGTRCVALLVAVFYGFVMGVGATCAALWINSV